MNPILAVFGATGKQGSSIITNVLADPQLSQQFRIRAITRDVNSERAKQIDDARVEVVQGDIEDPGSLLTALAGVHTVFVMTNPSFEPDGRELEFATGKAAVDAAVQQGVAYIVFSTLSNVSAISGGKYTGVNHFDAKAKIEEYIRTLPIKSAFVSAGVFMENFTSWPFYMPQPVDDGSYVISLSYSTDVKYPLFTCANDYGKFVTPTLAEPDRFKGETVYAAQGFYSMPEVAATIAKLTGKRVVYDPMSNEKFRTLLPPGFEGVAQFCSYSNEFGYWGDESEEKVAGTLKNVKVKLTTLEEYFVANPPIKT